MWITKIGEPVIGQELADLLEELWAEEYES